MGCLIIIILLLIGVAWIAGKTLAIAGAIAIAAVIFGAAIIKALSEDWKDRKNRKP